MKLPQIRLSTLMGLVGVVALDIALGRFSWIADGEGGGPWVCGIMPGILALQLGAARLVRAWRRGRRRRAFWIGFVLAGALATGSLIAGQLDPETVGTPNGIGTHDPGSMPYRFWMAFPKWACQEFVAPEVEGFWWHPNNIDDGPLGLGLKLALWGLPQLLAPVAGGLVAALIARLFGRRGRVKP